MFFLEEIHKGYYILDKCISLCVYVLPWLCFTTKDIKELTKNNIGRPLFISIDNPDRIWGSQGDQKWTKAYCYQKSLSRRESAGAAV